MVVLLLLLKYFLMRSSRNGQSHKPDIGIVTVILIRKWWRDTLSVRFQYLKLFTRELKFGNSKEKIGLEKTGARFSADLGTNNH